MAEEEMLKSGAIISDRYLIESRIGSGGYGEVLAARDMETQQGVALKVLHTKATDNDPRAVARMRQEAEILRAMDHPNIVRILEVGSFEGGQYLVMERIDGVGLDELMAEGKTLATDRLLPLLHQLLDALGSAHATDILHRDLKPENILVADVDGKETIKLVDFGVAKAGTSLNAEEPDDAITLVKTRIGNFVGTPRYAAPEMVVGDPAGPSADLFCVGLVVYEALVGRSLLQGTNHREFMNELVFPRPFDLDAVPEPWKEWLTPILEKSPTDRTQTAAEARRELDAIFSGAFALDDGLAVEDQLGEDSVPNLDETVQDLTAPPGLTDPESIAETNQWEPLELDYDALEEGRKQAREQALAIQEAQQQELQELNDDESLREPELTEVSTSSDTVLTFVIVALLIFIVLLLLVLWR